MSNKMMNGSFLLYAVIMVVILSTTIHQTYADVSNQIDTGIEKGTEAGTEITHYLFPSGEDRTNKILSAFADTLKKLKDLFFSFHHLSETTTTEGSEALGVNIDPKIITIVSVAIAGITILTIIEKLWKHWWKFVIAIVGIVLLLAYLGMVTIPYF